MHPHEATAALEEDLAERLAAGLAKLDSEANQQLATQLGIRSIPSLILFKNGKEIARQSGAFPLQQLKAWLQSHGVRA